MVYTTESGLPSDGAPPRTRLRTQLLTKQAPLFCLILSLVFSVVVLGLTSNIISQLSFMILNKLTHLAPGVYGALCGAVFALFFTLVSVYFAFKSLPQNVYVDGLTLVGFITAWISSLFILNWAKDVRLFSIQYTDHTVILHTHYVAIVVCSLLGMLICMARIGLLCFIRGK